MRFLVTAGPTREKIDEVRFWGNIFTGNTGLLIAKALADIGEVDLLTSNRQHPSEIMAMQSLANPIRGHGFSTHADLRELLERMVTQHEYAAVIMTAAIADYQPIATYAVQTRTQTNGQERWIAEDVSAPKVKSSHPFIAVLAQRTEKLIDLFRSQWDYKGLLIKFKLEVGLSEEELLRIGEESRQHSGADFLVANTLAMVGGQQSGAFLISATGHEFVGRSQLPQRLKQVINAWTHRFSSTPLTEKTPIITPPPAPVEADDENEL